VRQSGEPEQRAVNIAYSVGHFIGRFFTQTLKKQQQPNLIERNQDLISKHLDQVQDEGFFK